MGDVQDSKALAAAGDGGQQPTASATQAGADLLSGDARALRQRQLIDQLNSLGIGDLVSIPKIAVVGSQSAGKSSILEALSGITFPRAAGTCTRCPTEVRLFSGDQDWECNVSLRFEKDVDGNRLDSIKTVTFGDPIRDPTKVQHRLIRAQRAILNPTKPAESFLAKEDGEVEATADNSDSPAPGNDVQFSENVICVSVKGKNVRDLAVVDLPGLIANVGENEDERNIDLIRDLAKKEIAKPDCVILLCITMNEDFQNQPSVTLAKEADPGGLRTLGVLTKPDRVEDGTFSNSKPVLEGKEQRLLHNYYVVKNPDPTQLLTMTYTEARAAEKAYFCQDKWSSLGSAITSRLGSDRLAAKLSTLLEQIIRNRLPTLVKEVRSMHSKARKELESLPTEIKAGQALQTLHVMAKNFGDDFDNAVNHNRDDKGLAAKIYALSIDVWRKLMLDRPRVLLATLTEAKELIKKKEEVIGANKLIGQADFIYDCDKLDLEARDVIILRAPEGEVDEAKEVQKFVDLMQSHGDEIPSQRREHEERLYLTLSALKKIKLRATQDLLPKNCPWSVKEELIDICTMKWRSITADLLKGLEELMLEACNAMIENHFKRFRAGNLEAKARCIMENIITSRAEETRAFLGGLVTLESRYTTINSQTFLKQQEIVLKHFKGARADCKLRCKEIQGNKYVVEMFYQALNEDVTEEIELAAEIRAYWQERQESITFSLVLQVAFRRFTDNVRAAFYTIFIRAVVKDCLEKFPAELGLFEDGAASKAKRFLQEDPNIVQIRSNLAADENKLALGLKAINAFSTGAV